MAKRQTDEEQNLRRKARRRLIGAIALTLVVVVVLPMVLEREPKPTGQDIDLRIPDPEKAGEFIPGIAVPPESVSDQPGGNAASAVGSLSANTPAPVAAAEPAVVNKPEAPKKATQTKPEKPSAKPIVSRATDAPASKTTDTAVSAESYVVQVGAYSSTAAAKQELVKLKKWGFKAYTEKAGDKIRLRVGPYAGREKAEKIREQLEKHGLQPVVMSNK